MFDILTKVKNIIRNEDNTKFDISKIDKSEIKMNEDEIQSNGFNLLKNTMNDDIFEKYKSKRESEKIEKNNKINKMIKNQIIRILISFALMGVVVFDKYFSIFSINISMIIAIIVLFSLLIIGSHMFAVCVGSLKLSIEDLENFENTPLKTEDEVVIENFKSKQLTLSEINSLKSVISAIKSKMTEDEFGEVLLMTQEKTNLQIGNAYFYYILFSEYSYFLKSIRKNNKDKELLQKITNLI